jgi:alpha-1,2-mannosyltransferase
MAVSLRAAVERTAARMTPARMTGYAAALAVGLWVPYVLLFSLPGVTLPHGNRLAGDFAFLYLMGTAALRGQLWALYDRSAILSLGPDPVGDLHYPSVYPPYVPLAMAPFATVPYGWAVALWLGVTAAIYAASCYSVWRVCPRLVAQPFGVLAAAIGYPAFFYLIAFGQTSAPALACVTFAYLALRARRSWLAGVAIGALAYKPQLAIGFAVVFLLSRQWQIVIGAIGSVAVQVAATWSAVGTIVMSKYWSTVTDLQAVTAHLEPRLYHLHSLRGFFSMLLPWPRVALVFYGATSIAAMFVALRCWTSRASLQVRFAVVVIVTVLIDPHLNVYDLVILAPAFFLVTEWVLENPADSRLAVIKISLCASFFLPLLGPLAILTRFQASIVALSVLALALAGVEEARGRVPLHDAAAE